MVSRRYSSMAGLTADAKELETPTKITTNAGLRARQANEVVIFALSIITLREHLCRSCTPSKSYMGH